MKKLLTLLTLTALAALPATTFAADEKKESPTTKPAESKTAEGKGEKSAGGKALGKKEGDAPAAKPAESKPAEGKGPAEGKAMAMFVKVDAIDAAAKTFTHTNKDGTVVNFMITDKTEIKNGDAMAKLEDIKVGDTVSGSRIKKSPTEYEIVKITKFGVAAPKEKKGEGDKKPETEKKPEEKK